MNPAPSVIAFTVLSGMGFGLLALLGLGLPAPQGLVALAHWGLAYALAVGGLLAATFHLGNRKNALKAFSQWQSSWLSREAWASVACLVVLAPQALADLLGLEIGRGLGLLGAVLAVLTVLTTSMIYAQLKTVPRWHSPLTQALFFSFMLCGGAILAGQRALALLGCLAVAGALILAFRRGDTAFARAGQSLETATGLGGIGRVTVFEQPHTAPNYLMREMIFVVGRKHVTVLRRIALLAGAGLPLVLLVLPLGPWIFALAGISHLAGALAARWLFFAQAEHVVGLYYGRR